MKQILLMLLLNFSIRSAYWAHPTIHLGAVSLFCVLVFGKDTLWNIMHKECIYEEIGDKYYYAHYAGNDSKQSPLFLKPKRKGACATSANIIPCFLAQRYKCSLEEVYDIEYKEADEDAFVHDYYYKKSMIPLLGFLVGIAGLSISVYNFYINNYKL